jgi:hypothetical protein
MVLWLPYRKSAAWTPAMRSPAYWVDPFNSQSVIQATGGVSQWSDISGNNRHFTQSVEANRPAYSATAINGKPGIVYDGINDSLVIPVASWAYDYPIHAFVVLRVTTFTNQYNSPLQFYSGTTASTAGWVMFLRSNGRSEHYFTALTGQAGLGNVLTYATNQTYILELAIRENLAEAFGNGLADGTYSSPPFVPRTNVGSGSFAIGSDPRNNRYTNWAIGESFVLTGSALAQEERLLARNYLTQKWL